MSKLTGKKILFLITQTKYGGAQKYVLQLARYFSASNEVFIAVGEKNQQDEIFFEESRSLGIEPILLDYLIRDISIVSAFDATREIRRLLKKIKPDLFHINSSMAGVLGSCASWLYGFDPLNKRIPVIYTVHGFVFNEPLPPIKKKLYLIAEKISGSWKSVFITVSQFDKEQGIKHKIATPGRIFTIHNGLELTQKFITKEEARKQLKIPADNAEVIGTVASLYKTKGLEHLIQAMATLKDKDNLRLAIIGDGPEKKNLLQLIGELDLTNVVYLVGAKKNAAQYLKGFDVFVLPSVKEGLPLTILEAGLAGLPVVATRVGGVPEIIDNKKNGLLVDSQKPGDLSIAINHMLQDKPSAKELGRSLQKKIQQFFSLDKMLNQTDNLYCKFYSKISP
jgi:glycosyltransferase involved in cell wall biosynthesis